jgi:hypothetical protein
VEVTDLGQTTISERTQFVRQSSSFYLGLRRPDEVVVAGRPFPIQLAAVQSDGTPRAEPVSARVVIEKRNFHTVREQGAGGALNYRTETQFVSAFDNTSPALPLQKTEERWEVASSASVPQFTPNEVGSYRLRALTKDEAGHPVESSFDFASAPRNRARPTGIIATKRRSISYRTKNPMRPGGGQGSGQDPDQRRRSRHHRAGPGAPRFF